MEQDYGLWKNVKEMLKNIIWGHEISIVKIYLNMHNGISMFKFSKPALPGGGGRAVASPLWPLSFFAIDGCKTYIFVCLYVCVSLPYERCAMYWSQLFISFCL